MPDQEKVFSALASEARLEILKMVSAHSLCVNALVHKLDMSQPAVSQHLKILENAGLIKGEKRGPFVHYSLVSKNLEETLNYINKLVRR